MCEYVCVRVSDHEREEEEILTVWGGVVGYYVYGSRKSTTGGSGEPKWGSVGIREGSRRANET